MPTLGEKDGRKRGPQNFWNCKDRGPPPLPTLKPSPRTTQAFLSERRAIISNPKNGGYLMAPHAAALDGFDPLGADTSSGDVAALSQVFEESKKRDVQNILKSYTGTFDLFSELLQNSLDAVQARARLDEPGYKPHIWVYIDIPDRIVKVTDNGIGMDEDQFKYCLRPRVSFVTQADLRGQ